VHLSEQQVIRDKTAAIVLDWANNQRPPFTGDNPEGFAEAITVAHLVADEGRIGLHRWVDAARRSGLSWTEVGAALGISKQAAQQRFKPVDVEEPDGNSGAQVVRLGAHAFNEMAILREEGRKGNELVQIGALTLILRPTEIAWEYRRSFGLVRNGASDGWIYVAGWAPFQYFKRPISVD
jgi:hypothetical protein